MKSIEYIQWKCSCAVLPNADCQAALPGKEGAAAR